MSDGNWYWLPVVGVVAWAAVVIVMMVTGRTRKGDAGKLQAALDANTAVNQQMVARLEAMDKRLAVVEKTLTDIG